MIQKQKAYSEECKQMSEELGHMTIRTSPLTIGIFCKYADHIKRAIFKKGKGWLLLFGTLLLLNACSKEQEIALTGAKELTMTLSKNKRKLLLTVMTTEKDSGGYSTATGSSDLPITVSTLKELKSAFQNGNHHILVNGKISGGPVPLTFLFATTNWNNTTISGVTGSGAALENIQLKFDGELLAPGMNIENIIVNNISFNGDIASLQVLPPSETDINVPGNHSGVNYVGVSFRRCTNVTFDHCAVYDISDDLWCVTLASDNITVSNCHFYFTADWLNMKPNPNWNWVGTSHPLADERIAAVIGYCPEDSYSYGIQKLHVTIHDNWFGPLLKGRPLCRGYVHFYNNYFDNSVPGSSQYDAIQIGSGAKVFSESNYFDQTNKTNKVYMDDKIHQSYTFCERKNIYKTNSIGAVGDAWPDSLVVPYHYNLVEGSEIPGIVTANAGPH